MILFVGTLAGHPVRAERRDAGSSVFFVWDSMLGDLGMVDQASGATAPFWVRAVINLIGAAVVLGSAYLLFRTPRYTHTLDAADEARVRTLLRDFGGEDSLGYFATRRDKSVVWDSGEAGTARAGISYRVVGSVSLASGNPLGDPLRWPEAIEAWRRQARTNGWSLAVMGAGQPRGRRVHRGGPQGVGDRRRGHPRPADASR